MRFINMFLAGYVVLVLGGSLALWQLGVFSRVAPVWIVVAALVAVGAGIMMAVSSGKPAITQEVRR